MAHKKKGGSKKPSAPSGPQANGTSSPREDAPVPASFKDAILKDAVVDGSGKIALHASSTYHLTTSVLLSQQCLWAVLVNSGDGYAVLLSRSACNGLLLHAHLSTRLSESGRVVQKVKEPCKKGHSILCKCIYLPCNFVDEKVRQEGYKGCCEGKHLVQCIGGDLQGQWRLSAPRTAMISSPSQGLRKHLTKGPTPVTCLRRRHPRPVHPRLRQALWRMRLALWQWSLRPSLLMRVHMPGIRHCMTA